MKAGVKNNRKRPFPPQRCRPHCIRYIGNCAGMDRMTAGARQGVKSGRTTGAVAVSWQGVACADTRGHLYIRVGDIYIYTIYFFLSDISTTVTGDAG
jgi:hypothetical protein